MNFILVLLGLLVIVFGISGQPAQQQQTSWLVNKEQQQERLGFDLNCETCQFFTKELFKYLKDGNHTESLKDFLDHQCDKLPSPVRSKCHQFTGKLTDILHILPELIERQNYNSLALCGMLHYCKVPCCKSDSQPEQIHTTYMNETYRGVLWTTGKDDCSEVKVTDHATGQTITYSGETYTYHKGGWVGSLHRSVVPMKINQVYTYQVGCEASGSWSKVYQIDTKVKNKLVYIADMGLVNSENTIERLKDHVTEYDLILFNGDLSYADGNQGRWDEMHRTMQPVFARTPVQTNTGNHEIGIIGLPQIDIAGYHYRWTMPGFPQPEKTNYTNLYYSFDYGNIHMAVINTENTLDLPFVSDAQLKWLQSDLQKVNREKTPHVFVMGHRPLYCSVKICQNSEGTYLRDRLESIFKQYKVDIYFSGHCHNYERSYPVYQGKVSQKDFKNPQDTVYVLQGFSGNREGPRGFDGNQYDWSAYKQNKEVGYGVIETTQQDITWKFYASSTDQVIDEFTLTKS